MSLATRSLTHASSTGVNGPAVHDLWVLGAGGMMAGEFLRLAAAHPQLKVRHAITRNGGEKLSELHPHLTHFGDLSCVGFEEFSTRILSKWVCDLEEGRAASTWLVAALPHGQAAGTWARLRAELKTAAQELGVVDLSADYRLDDPELYERWYGGPHPDVSAMKEFVYGLPEAMGKSLSGARRIAAPGCFATALQLACLPPARAGILDGDAPWILHAATGSSGSGAKPKTQTHHPYRHGNFWSYASDGHRHEAELQQALLAIGLNPVVTFLPHSGPWSRGIHLSAVLPLTEPVTRARVQALFQESYGERPFVHVLAEGVPDLRRVVGSNVAALGFRVLENTLVVELTLDNLIKGGSGQALQALNLALDLPETTGLSTTGMGTL
ncbi:MAG: N-acetyl-gamma-glutamyl-phosphate reductase [Planctomycetes bacterium]|nr:N-acetyl-gamma-glutamyl-phosphate reductase [Planctomycetota bacterium]